MVIPFNAGARQTWEIIPLLVSLIEHYCLSLCLKWAEVLEVEKISRKKVQKCRMRCEVTRILLCTSAPDLSGDGAQSRPKHPTTSGWNDVALPRTTFENQTFATSPRWSHLFVGRSENSNQYYRLHEKAQGTHWTPKLIIKTATIVPSSDSSNSNNSRLQRTNTLSVIGILH